MRIADPYLRHEHTCQLGKFAPCPQQQQLFGGELLRIIADHPTISLQHDIRALCWPKGTVSQLLFLFLSV